MADIIPVMEAVIGLEIHAELKTKSKMFCGCPVLDVTEAAPNSAVCPVCAGFPGTLPVVNRRAVEYALRVAIALECNIAPTSIFARKNYFYPDLPKGYQISQYEQPLAVSGRLEIETTRGPREVHIRRVHLEEDTGKLTHVIESAKSFSLVDLNRAGVPLLEIVSDPDMHSVEEVRAYASALRSLLRCLGVNSGDMQKGVLRIEPNVSIRRQGSNELGTRTEIKNLNSLRALERSVAFEIERQSEIVLTGGKVLQETRGWDETTGVTVSQRVKEEADDYRYFPEPDLPPLVIDADWINIIRSDLPELPKAKCDRLINRYHLGKHEAKILAEDREIAEYFEHAVSFAPEIPPTMIAHWIIGDLFGLLNQFDEQIEKVKITPENFAGLVKLVYKGKINQFSGKSTLDEMFRTGMTANEIVAAHGLNQISNEIELQEVVDQVIAANPDQVEEYFRGKKAISQWLLGQVMRMTGGRANPAVAQEILEKKLKSINREGPMDEF